ncbi:hypothetical protein OSB04_015140 [Centaurea solstitialis]|uniref:Protein kinase domain-containing protein n=1 Tax=Centaurea solstitialis TaxID=347529 RepID=A0AA38TAE4_9ASTR|nr:hypothetical protein OSB04_015140 [Centaurea solstitialis]
MEDRKANTIAIASIILLIIFIVVSRILFALTEPFFLILGASIAAILAIVVFHFIRRRFQSRRRKMETVIASTGAELRIEYSFLRKVAGLPTKYPFEELEEATDKWRLLIGEGASGSVFRGKLKDGTEVAVKRIQHGEERGGKERGGKEFRSEIAAIASVQHVNLVRLFGYCSTHGNKSHYLVYDFIPNGSLSNWIFSPSTPSSAMEPDDSRAVTSLRGTKKATSKPILRLLELEAEMWSRDRRSESPSLPPPRLPIQSPPPRRTKPENILINENYNAIVSDFGISKLMKPDDSRVVTSLRGTKGYIAPEWLLGLAISEKSDVFSYGVVLLEIIGGRRSLRSVEFVDNESGRPRKRLEYFPKVVKEKLREGKIMEVVDPRLLSDRDLDENEVTKMVHVALWCIQHKARRRPSMVEVVKWLEGRAEVAEPPETAMMVVDLLAGEGEGDGGNNGGGQNRNKRRKLGVVARVASQINGCLTPNTTSSMPRSNTFATYSLSIISPR